MASPEPDRAPRPFPSTQWSLVLRSRGTGEEARRALADLCQTYWFPLYAWCRRSGLSPVDAEDAVQGFFVEVLQKHLFTQAEAARGSLRGFLLTALRRHVKDQRQKSQCERRGGGRLVSFDALEAESWYAESHIDGENADHLYDRQWALTVLDKALNVVESPFVTSGKSHHFSVMRRYLTESDTQNSLASDAALLGMSQGTLKVAIHRLRTKFRHALRLEVAQTQDTSDSETDLESEIAYLLKALARNSSPA